MSFPAGRFCYQALKGRPGLRIERAFFWLIVNPVQSGPPDPVEYVAQEKPADLKAGASI